MEILFARFLSDGPALRGFLSLNVIDTLPGISPWQLHSVGRTSY